MYCDLDWAKKYKDWDLDFTKRKNVLT